MDTTALHTADEQSGDFRSLDQRLRRLYPGAPEKRVKRLYNEVSDVLARRLAPAGASSWEDVWPVGGHGTEQAITDAVVAVLEPKEDGDLGSALVVQGALLRGCVPAVREYYRNRLLDVVTTPRGRLAPDFLLDGRRHSPPVNVPNLLAVEVKYLARWQCPLAMNLFGRPAGFGYDGGLIFGAGHGTSAGIREPHRLDDLFHCEDYWHSPVGGGLYVTSAIQLDIYLAFIRPVLSALGLDEPARMPELRPHGVLLDGWQRRVDDQVAVTHDRWSTTGFSQLLIPVASRYEALRRIEPDALKTHRMRVLLGRLLYL